MATVDENFCGPMLNKLLQLMREKAELQTLNRQHQERLVRAESQVVRAESQVDQLLKQNAQLMEQLQVACRQHEAAEIAE